jgi:hypothetical protein
MTAPTRLLNAAAIVARDLSPEKWPAIPAIPAIPTISALNHPERPITLSAQTP